MSFFSFQYVEGQGVHNLQCIPPMIDFEAIFENTLRLRPQFRNTIEEIKRRKFKPPDCTEFNTAVVDNIWALNVQRCTQGSPIEFQCITTSTSTTTTSTTSTTTTTTTTTRRPTTTTDFKYPWQWSSTTIKVGGVPSPATVSPVTFRTSRPPPSAPSPPTPDSGGGRTTKHPGDQDTSGATYIPLPTPTGVIPTVEAVVSRQSDITVTVISVGAALLGLLLIIGLLFLCRYVFIIVSVYNIFRLRMLKNIPIR